MEEGWKEGAERDGEDDSDEHPPMIVKSPINRRTFPLSWSPSRIEVRICMNRFEQLINKKAQPGIAGWAVGLPGLDSNQQPCG